MQNQSKVYDCVIIGGGPGGLTAGIYLSRFLCKTVIVDNRTSRASLIPCSHNYPGFPNGISGKDLLKLLRKQSLKYGTQIITDTTLNLSKNKKIFTIQNKESRLHTRYVILATGVMDIEPDLPNLEEAIKKGLIRHCLVCDGYEVRNKKIAILGEGRKGVKEAFLLSGYSNQVTLFTLGKKPRLTKREYMQLKEKGIRIISEPIYEVGCVRKKITSFVTLTGTYSFDTVYSALGTKVRSELAIDLGAASRKNNKLIVNDHLETSVSGLYAIGDIVTGLNQICTATAQAAVAATDIFNNLKGL